MYAHQRCKKIHGADETHSRQNQLMKQGLDALRMHVDLTPRNISNPRDQCGYTTFGCARGNKKVRQASVSVPNDQPGLRHASTAFAF